jgi:hypothetical protein
VQLHGLWKVSLCITRGHAWIRYESVDTGEVHTIGRYSKGEGGRVDPQTGRQVWPETQEAGLQWDMDLRYEPHIRKGRFLLLSVLVDSPRIIRGEKDGYGHGIWHVNCVTYARDAWACYTGEYYDLPIIALPDDFRAEVVRRHPEVLIHARPDESQSSAARARSASKGGTGARRASNEYQSSRARRASRGTRVSLQPSTTTVAQSSETLQPENHENPGSSGQPRR